MNNRTLIGLANRARILNAIVEVGNRTARELSNELGITERSVHAHINALKANKQIYISAWTKNIGVGGCACPYYSAGDQEDKRYHRKGKRDCHERRNQKMKHQGRVVKMGGSTNPFASLIAQL